MRRAYVAFVYEGEELLSYTLFGESEGEREETIKLLAYENDISEDDIECEIVCR